MVAQAAVDPDQAAEWFVPVIVSEPRADTDKGVLPLILISLTFLAAPRYAQYDNDKRD